MLCDNQFYSTTIYDTFMCDNQCILIFNIQVKSVQVVNRSNTMCRSIGHGKAPDRRPIGAR